jgi:hypothetical protein
VQIHEDDAKKLDLKVRKLGLTNALDCANDVVTCRMETLSRWKPATERPSCQPRSARLKRVKSLFLSIGERISKVDMIT